MPALTYGEPETTSTDPGLFGPDSVTWRIHADPATGVGGLRAILLQTMLPGPMVAAASSSGYRRDPWGRLVRTAEYIGATTYGTAEEAHRAGAAVRQLHGRLGLDDPDWLLWVHAAFVDSLLGAYRRSGARLRPGDADAYVREQVVAAELVGLPAERVFADEAGLRGYLADVSPQLRATDEAVDFIRFAFVPPMPTTVRWLTPAAGGWAALVACAFGLLPRAVRSELARGLAAAGVPLLGPALAPAGQLMAAAPVADWQATLALRSLRAGLGRLPDSVREGPHLRAARTRLALV
ncbi:MAG: oxygenase MpaB family protein [Candidatus Nanopelagicales bacterium]